MICVFADEAGCATFNESPHVSRYFITCTVACPDHKLGDQLTELRRRLAAEGTYLDKDQFHATEDEEAVRRSVFEILSKSPVRVDATVFEKSKANPAVRADGVTFFQFAWKHHLTFVSKYVFAGNDDVRLFMASYGSRKDRARIRVALEAAVQKTGLKTKCTALWSSSSDPCLQVADYYAWAIQRKLERGDRRYYDLIRHHIRSEYDIFRRSERRYYAAFRSIPSAA